MQHNRITQLFNIQYPIIQAGMIWASGWKLASAVSNAGGLGIIGAGSMYPDVLKEHVTQCQAATDKPFAVNVPLLYPDIDKVMDIIVNNNVKIVFTSAGNPATWTPFLKEKGIKVVHVVSSVKFAQKAEKIGVDAIVAEGFEAGGHNGREETTTFTLIPMVSQAVDIPVIAAGGIGNGQAILAAMVLGADAAQLGTRFVASYEASSHQTFKDKVVSSHEGETMLTLKELAPVRMMKNKFFSEIQELYQKGTSKDELKQHLGRARAKRGMFEGDLENGELEIGQISGLITEILPAQEIVKNLVNEYKEAQQKVSGYQLA